MVDDKGTNVLSSVNRRIDTRGGSIEPLADGGMRLTMQPGSGGNYRVAQFDDTRKLSRGEFRWQTPFTMRLQARVSDPDLPGTWGFGLWNDPFSTSLHLGGGSRRLPVLPNSAWFFHASPENFLSLRDDLPGNGFLTAVFSSPLIPSVFLSPAAISLPLLTWRPGARLIRRLARRWIKEGSTALELDTTVWHRYEIRAGVARVDFSVDDKIVLESAVSPRGRLGLVIWIDNQYAAFTPQGQLRYGRLAVPSPAWLEIKDVSVQQTV